MSATENSLSPSITSGLLFSRRKAIAEKVGVPMTEEFNAIVRETCAALAAQPAQPLNDELVTALWMKACEDITGEPTFRVFARLVAQTAQPVAVPDGDRKAFEADDARRELGSLLMSMAVIRELTGTQQCHADETVEAVRTMLAASPTAPSVAPLASWPICGIRVDEGTVVIVANGGVHEANHAARWMCEQLLSMRGAGETATPAAAPEKRPMNSRARTQASASIIKPEDC